MGFYWVVEGYISLNWGLLGLLMGPEGFWLPFDWEKPSREKPGNIEITAQQFSSVSGFPRVLLDVKKFYRVSLGITGFYWVLLGFTGFQWVSIGFTGLYFI